jgi:BMFP domain-containing protein YqiC
MCCREQHTAPAHQFRAKKARTNMVLVTAYRKELALPTNPFDLNLIQQRLSELLQTKGLSNLQNPVTQLMKQSLQDMEFVTQEELETQRQVLYRLREQVKALEAKVTELEQKK